MLTIEDAFILSSAVVSVWAVAWGLRVLRPSL
ncbi:MAG: hypothetical protein RIQ94_3053 [Pseudomonadota bacterium]|jgi:hypothetical protein